MKILMISRATLFKSPGGDTVQIVNTAKYLKKLNIEVDIKTADDKIKYNQYDLLHFFNIIRPADILYHAKKSKKKYVISTIYVNYQESEKNLKGIRGVLSKILSKDQIEYIKTLSRFIFSNEKIKSWEYLIYGHKKSIIKIAKYSSLLLPNSNSEYHRFEKDYKTKKEYMVIPNAVDDSIFNYQNVNEDLQYKDTIVCAARIEPRKNQLNLIKALNNTNYKLIIIGKPSINHYKYYDRCKKEAGTNIKFIEHITQQELARILKAAKVHVLPSWFETTGLSSLEAAFMKCNIVVTKKGDTEEYFKNFAWYCEPDSITSILNAINNAFKAEYNDNFYKYISKNYTWKKTAEKTYQAYKNII